MNLAAEHRSEFGESLLIKDVPELLRRYLSSSRRPGKEFKYSNTNYVLLAAIIESVSGTSFEQFMQKELFGPLGMKDSRVFNRVSKTPFPARAEDFRNRNGVRMKLSMTWIDGVAGDGACFCSLKDFLKWNEFWNGKTDVVGKKLLAEAFRKPKLIDGTVSSYGFGWSVENEMGRAWHNGAWLGARTCTMRDPQSKRFFVLLDNSGNLLAEKIARTIKNQFLLAKFTRE